MNRARGPPGQPFRTFGRFTSYWGGKTNGVRSDGQLAGAGAEGREGDDQAGPRRRGRHLCGDGQEGRARGAGLLPYRARRGEGFGGRTVPRLGACAVERRLGTGLSCAEPRPTTTRRRRWSDTR